MSTVVPFQQKEPPPEPVDVPPESPAVADPGPADSDAKGGGGGAGGPPRDHVKEAGPCPVKALGCAGGVYRFVDFRGELHELSETKLFGRGGLARLFGGDMAWLRKAFPRTETSKDEDGNVKEVTKGINERAACLHLMRLCADEPMWDAGVPVKGIGVWPFARAGESGCLVHLGDIVGFASCEPPRRSVPSTPVDEAGEPLGLDIPWRQPGFKLGRGWFLARAPLDEMPAREPAATATGRTLVDLFSYWNWDEATAPSVLLGLMAQGMLGAASPWRGHSIVVGIEGCGKSSLIGLLAEMLPMAKVFDEFSEAGVRNAFENEARTVILDEAEGEEASGRGGGGAVERTIRFLRRLSGESGARSVRGTQDGGARTASASGAAILGAIRPPAMDAQDITRFTVLNLRPLGLGSADRLASVNRLRRELAGSGPAILARMLVGRDRYLESFGVAKAMLVQTRDLEPRQADQIACAMAGYWTMLSDTPLAPGVSLDALADQTFGFVIARVRENSETESTPMQCWRDLLSLQPDVWGGGTRHSVASLLGDALLPDANEQRRKLLELGIRVAIDPSSRGRKPGVYIANQCEPMAKLFASGVRGRRWASGWGDALKDLPGAEAAKLNFGRGGTDRATFLPLDASYMPRGVESGSDELVEFRQRPPEPPEGDV